MESIRAIFNEEFGIGFRADYEIPTGVVSLVNVGVGGELAKIQLQGMFRVYGLTWQKVRETSSRVRG